MICGVYSKSFDTKNECVRHLDSHQNTYLDTNPIPTFPCDECNDMFLQISILKTHKIEIHKSNNSEKTLNEISDYNYLKNKIDSSLNILHENIDSSIINLKEKFDSSLDMLHLIINEQSKVILQLEEKIEALSNQVNQNSQQHVSTQQNVPKQKPQVPIQQQQYIPKQQQ